MSNFLTSSIGKKVIMSLSGLFLISFLCVHLALNLLLIFDNSGALFNQGAHFMATNPIIKIIEPILAIGFIIHIIWASVLTLQNQKARPVKYALRNQSQNATWASRNMYILGAMVLIFLVIHLYNFWWNIKFPSLGTPLSAITVGGVEMEDTWEPFQQDYISLTVSGLLSKLSVSQMISGESVWNVQLISLQLYLQQASALFHCISSQDWETNYL